MGDSVVAEEGRAAAASCKPARQQAVLGIVGWSGSGKTTLIERLLPALCLSGMRVSTIKHSHHDIVLDAEGKDSARHRLAGAACLSRPHNLPTWPRSWRGWHRSIWC